MHFWGNYNSNLYNWHCFLIFGFLWFLLFTTLNTHLVYFHFFLTHHFTLFFWFLQAAKTKYEKKLCLAGSCCFCCWCWCCFGRLYFFICRASRDELLKVCSNVLCAMLMRAYEDASTTHVSSSSSSSSSGSTVHNLIKFSQKAKLKRKKEKGKAIFADN